MSTTTPGSDEKPTAAVGAADPPSSTSFIEAILDSLPTWTIIAAAIALLYLVWATLEILARYVEFVPSVSP